MPKSTGSQHRLRFGRYSDVGLWYFITTVTSDRRPLLSHPRAAAIVLQTLRWLDSQKRIRLIVAVVMPDHLHFIAELKAGTIASVMHSLKSFSANAINGALHRYGSVWQSQYCEHGIRNGQDLFELVRYCLENPVRKGLVGDFHSYPHWYCVYDV